MAENWLPEDERRLYDSTVHNLRMRGWSRMDAEDEALEKLLELRDRKADVSA